MKLACINIKLPFLIECTYIRKDSINYKPKITNEKFPSNLDVPNDNSKPDYEIKGYPYTI